MKLRAAFLAFIFVTAASARADVDPAGLALHYTFDRNEGATVPDDSGHGRVGRVHGATYRSTGLFGSCYAFGPGTWIESPAPEFLRGATALTWCAWIKPMALDKHLMTVLGTTQTDNGGIFLLVSTRPEERKVAAYVCAEDTIDQRGADAHGLINTGAWQHVLATYDGVATKVYLNGALVGSSNSVGFQAAHYSGLPLTVGDSCPGRLWSFDGLIDEVRLYTRVLTDPEIAALGKLAYQPLASYELTLTRRPDDRRDELTFRPSDPLFVRLHRFEPAGAQAQNVRATLRQAGRPGELAINLELQQDGSYLGKVSLADFKPGTAQLDTVATGGPGNAVRQTEYVLITR